METQPLLEIDELSVSFPSGGGSETLILDRVSMKVMAGEVFGVIGQTGAGKSMTAAAAIGLVPAPGRVAGGRVLFEGQDVLAMGEDELRRLRGKEISTIVQNPRAALNPVLPVGRQIANVYQAHNEDGRKAAEEAAHEALQAVGLPEPRRLAKAYPHQLSGGMAQRVLIAMALVNTPRLVMADEPTTGLDVTIQAEILDLMMGLVKERGTAIMLITHDLGVIANYCDRASVMLAGQVVESAPTLELFEHPLHSYTKGLIEAFTLDSLGAGHMAARPAPSLAYEPPVCVATAPRPAEPSQGAGDAVVFEEASSGHWVRCRQGSQLMPSRADRAVAVRGREGEG